VTLVREGSREGSADRRVVLDQQDVGHRQTVR
jgi:hypothetical protein